MPKDVVILFDSSGGRLNEAKIVRQSLVVYNPKDVQGTGLGFPLPNHLVKHTSLKTHKETFAVLVPINFG